MKKIRSGGVTVPFALTLDRHGVVLAVNSRLAKFMGYERHELIGKQWYTLGAKRLDTQRRFLRVMRGEEPLVRDAYVSTLVKRDGTEARCMWHSTIDYSADGKPLRITSIGYLRDVDVPRFVAGTIAEATDAISVAALGLLAFAMSVL